MSNIKKLLEGVEVEWKTLGEIAENVSSGGTPNTGVEAFYGGNIPWLRTQEVGNGDIWSTSIKITELGLKNSSAKIIPANCIIVAMYGATVGKVGVNKIPLCTNQACANVQINAKIANYRYVYHFLAELQAELQARKSQYEYYRNQLLAYSMEESDQSSLRSNRSATSIQNSDNSTQPLSTLNPHTGNSVLQPRGKVEWKVLEEVVEIKRGKRLIKNQLEKTGKYAVYQNCMIPLGYYHKNNVIADTTFIISAGSAGEIGYSDVDFWAADDVYYFVTKNDLKSRFLYHFLITQQQKIYSQVRRSSVPRLSKTAFEKLLIPIPPLEEQERIVSILDKFDTLTTSLTEGLPKEIELRQKQYEYYRNMLLSFPKNNIKA